MTKKRLKELEKRARFMVQVWGEPANDWNHNPERAIADDALALIAEVRRLHAALEAK